MTTETDRKAKELASQIVALCKPLHGQKLVGNLGHLRLYFPGHSRICVEFFSAKQHTQSLLGNLGVLPPYKEPELLLCEGVYYQYENEFQQRPQRIQLTGSTAEEIVEKMTNCLAPLLDFGNWPPVVCRTDR